MDSHQLPKTMASDERFRACVQVKTLQRVALSVNIMERSLLSSLNFKTVKFRCAEVCCVKASSKRKMLKSSQVH